MKLLLAIQSSFISMVSNKVRTLLTVIGIVIGIASVIIVFSAGEGIKGLVLSQVQSFGTDFIETEIKVPSSKQSSNTSQEAQSGANIAMGVQITTLTLKDMEDINKLPNVEDSYAAILSQEQVSYGNELRKALIFGVNASYVDIDQGEIGEGRFFTDAEDKSLSQVVVLGSKIKEKLFGDSDAIGQSIKIKKSKYRVIGVMKKRGAVMTLDFDDYVYLPIRTLQKRIMGIDHVFYAIHKIKDMSKVEETADEIRIILRENHDIPEPVDPKDIGRDDFRVMSMTEMMDMLDTITGAITLLLLAIVVISLVVGGVGIMNIMYVIVTERTSEIGLRKAVGAKYSDIMRQFLVESIIITIIGGIIGILFGVLISFVIAWMANYYGLDWRFAIPLKAYLVAFGFSVVFGVFFGLLPARKAARLDPIEALRKE